MVPRSGSETLGHIRSKQFLVPKPPKLNPSLNQVNIHSSFLSRTRGGSSGLMPE